MCALHFFCLCSSVKRTADGCLITVLLHPSGRIEWKSSGIDVKMGDFEENFETDDIVDKLLIEHVRERPSLYYTDACTGLDEYYWDEIQKNTGIQSLYLYLFVKHSELSNP